MLAAFAGLYGVKSDATNWACAMPENAKNALAATAIRRGAPNFLSMICSDPFDQPRLTDGRRQIAPMATKYTHDEFLGRKFDYGIMTPALCPAVDSRGATRGRRWYSRTSARLSASPPRRDLSNL